MKLNSKAVGVIILLVILGGILLFTGLGWWQTEGSGQGKGKHRGDVPVYITLTSYVDYKAGTIRSDTTCFSNITVRQNISDLTRALEVAARRG